MKKNLIAIIVAIFISVPSLFAFHDLATDHLVPGMPVVFIATGPKFPPAMHDAVRTALGRWSSSDCFMSLQNSIDAAVDAEGRGMVIMRWATKEAYVHDQKKMNPKLCAPLIDFRKSLVKLGGVKPTDLKFSTFTAIASSPRSFYSDPVLGSQFNPCKNLPPDGIPVFMGITGVPPVPNT